MPWSTSRPRRPPCASPSRSPSRTCSARCAPPGTAPRSSAAHPQPDHHESPRPRGRARGGAQASRPRRCRAHRARRRPRDGARHPPRRRPVGAARARHPGRALGRMAVPPGRRRSTPATAPRRWTPSCRSGCSPPTCGRPSSCSPVARRGMGSMDGADAGGHHAHLVRDRDRRHDVPAHRALDGGAGHRPHPRRPARAADAWAPRTSPSSASTPRPGPRPRCASRSTSSPSATGSSCGPARRSPPTAGSSRARARSTPRS